ncbi:protein EFFECTOR OF TRANSCRIPTION 2 isoform X1 [Populus alba]|uniref:Putative transciption factor family protein n=1 Tax=Populus alba TaxID=43335 RepID=A0A4U5QRM1_POPAL|nr:protein EFFECTOR OF TRANSCRIPTION 2 isoform X1 [Populus alba]TKS13528.1 putative transciption factor family protein [Populus alba]
MDVGARLKREDCRRTKHDSSFSKWQLLIGHSDWQDYLLGKEGASRYRIHNLPTTSGPGLYELGIAVPRSGLLRRDVGKLVPDDIVVVYLGQADSVRTRLQQYGRSGAHLGNTYSTGHVNDSKDDSLKKGLGLFEEIFSRGQSIVYRWAPMKDKRYAEETEGKLLGTFDYAWNKGSNGTRRPGDVLQKLNKTASSTTRPLDIFQWLPFSSYKLRGIKIKASKPLSPEKHAGFGDEDSKKLFSGIFKLSRSQPRLVTDKYGINEDFDHTCGFIMVDGISCTRPPLPGRKRCEEHKGRRLYGSSYKSIVQGNLHYQHGANLDSTSHNDQEHETTCGENLGDGTFCRKQAVAGRKRCNEHKGMRVNTSVSEPEAEDKIRMSAPSSVFNSFADSINNNASSKHNAESTWQCGSSNNPAKEHFPNICGVMLGNGSFCRRQPIQGNKRCWQHKGQRVECNLSGVDSSEPAAEEKIPMFAPSSVFNSFADRVNNNASSKHNAYSTWQCGSSDNPVKEHFPNTCGVMLGNGSFCRRQPIQGNKRCWQHKGKRVECNLSGVDSSSLGFDAPICAVTLRDGSVCLRAPVQGRKRCDQHKGMRVSTSYNY